VHLSGTECPHSEVLERWSASFWNRMPTLQGFGKMECIFLEWNAHTPRFLRDGVQLSEIECPHSEVSERWSASFRNRMPTLRGFGEMECTFPKQNTHTLKFWKDGMYLFGTEYTHSNIPTKCSAYFPFGKCLLGHFECPTFLFWLQPTAICLLLLPGTTEPPQWITTFQLR